MYYRKGKAPTKERKLIMYKCRDCGKVFENAEEKGTRGEYLPECTCPHCGSEDYDKAIECEECGEYYLADDLTEGVCPECIKGFANDLEMCYKVGKCDEREIKINGFLLSMFEVEDIEKILLGTLKARKNLGYDINGAEYINESKEWFVRHRKGE
jgi:DNA-directed RNA polymerase subunit RPC12/RpoP